MKILVTGGAGFIGSQLVEFLLNKGDAVTVFDNLSTGKEENLEQARTFKDFIFVKGDIKDSALVDSTVKGHEMVFHLCDNSDIRFAASHPNDYFNQNIFGAFYLLESMRKWGVKKIIFPSSTTVLGDANQVPSPESYGPLQPMNLYGGAKMACEGILSAYAFTFDMHAWLFRFVDIVGGRMDHGVIHDFVKKLKKNPKELEILGDGSQRRSFLLIDDCIDGIWKAIHQFEKPVNLVHLGNTDQISITRVGELVCQAMELEHVTFKYTGGKKGWKGDSFTNFISNDSLKSAGWHSSFASEATVLEAAKRLWKQIRD